MKNFIKPLLIACTLSVPTLAVADEHNHSHNHYSPALEQLGNDIIGLTVCYKNGYLTDENQEPAFTNLISHADVTGEELGMFYMDKLGQKAESIMGDEQSRLMWTEDFCSDLTATYLDLDKLAQAREVSFDHSDHHGHDHGHSHGHEGHGVLSPEVIEQDIERGRLLSIH
ncbi:hypothetical protein [Vibrio gallicus]|uniref:hypothetical protein n=1 Tax=Vibrio gallicus TaxID=190897 RepID=UPI0021C29D8A|nr:hypothetical protein [Vibrio gallicus]